MITEQVNFLLVGTWGKFVYTATWRTKYSQGFPLSNLESLSRRRTICKRWTFLKIKDAQNISVEWKHAAATANSLQSCPTLWDPIDGSPPSSPVPGFSRQEHWSGLPFPSPMHESEKWKWSRSVVSHVRLFMTPWTAAYQAPLSMGWSIHKYPQTTRFQSFQICAQLKVASSNSTRTFPNLILSTSSSDYSSVFFIISFIIHWQM